MPKKQSTENLSRNLNVENLKKFHNVTMNINGMADKIRSSGLSDATIKYYTKDFEDFAIFCLQLDRSYLPASGEIIDQYLKSISNRSFTSIARIVAAIKKYHAVCMLKDPISKNTFSQIRKSIGSSRESKPILYDTLLKMINSLPNTAYGQRNKAILLLSWFCALKKSEISNMNISDIEYTDDGMNVHIGKKTLFIPNSPDNRICICSYFKNTYSKLFTSVNGPLFPKCKPVDLFFISNKRISKELPTKIVKNIMSDIGLPSQNYTALSLRKGFIQQCIMVGINYKFIEIQSNHSCNYNLSNCNPVSMFYDRSTRILD